MITLEYNINAIDSVKTYLNNIFNYILENDTFQLITENNLTTVISKTGTTSKITLTYAANDFNGSIEIHTNNTENENICISKFIFSIKNQAVIVNTISDIDCLTSLTNIINQYKKYNTLEHLILISHNFDLIATQEKDKSVNKELILKELDAIKCSIKNIQDLLQ